MIKDKKVFITGGAGFIANHIIARLIEDNNVVVYDNFERDTLSHSGYIKHKNMAVIRGDILDYKKVEEGMKGADIVVHAAAIAGIDTVIKIPTKTMRVNTTGTANVLEAAKQNGIKGRFINFSTSEVFGSLAFKPTEDFETVAGSAGEARWSYAVSKLVGEHLSMAYYREFGIPVVSVRPFNIYGPGQTGGSAMQIFIKSALKNSDIHIHGDGNQIRAWCYIDDCIDCLMECMEDPKAIGEAFNIGNSRAVITVYGLAQTICRVLNSKSKILFVPPLSAEVELRIPCADKAYKLLGFKAKIDLEEGITKTAEWFRGHSIAGETTLLKKP